jgi:uncharacterized protein (DUF342 family)
METVIDSDQRAMREKHWGEKNDSEKIEKLKNELIRTQNQVKRICDSMALLQNHFHASDQTLAVRVKNANEESCGGFYFRVEEFKTPIAYTVPGSGVGRNG